jgi:folate-binding protein YgfZ
MDGWISGLGGLRRVAGSEIDATAILFPIPVTGWIGALAATDFRGRNGVRNRRRRSFRTRKRRLPGFGTWIRLAYHRCIHNSTSLSPTPMSDNLHDAATDAFSVSGWHVLVISGRDALAFAQAQFMNDVAALADGHWQWNGWLTPKGRVIALFALLRITADTLWLVVPDADPATLSAQLQNYVFRSKVSLGIPDDLHASGRFSMPSHAVGARFRHIGAAIELDLSGDGAPRTLLLDATTAPVNSTSESAWRAQDLLHGLPRLDTTQAEHWTPQQLSLDRLRAFSVKKGCYPGQEIVARTHYLGQAKRGLALYQAASTVTAGTDIEQDGRVIGSIVCTDHALALGVVQLEAASQPAASGSIALAPQALLGGLAR